MDLNRLIGMLTRMFVRSAVNTGMDLASRNGKPAAEMTPEEREQAKAAKAMTDKARKAARLTRRFRR